MAYGKPVVSKVTEKYPVYMTTVDTKVRLRYQILHLQHYMYFVLFPCELLRPSLSPSKKTKHDRLSENS